MRGKFNQACASKQASEKKREALNCSCLSVYGCVAPMVATGSFTHTNGKQTTEYIHQHQLRYCLVPNSHGTPCLLRPVDGAKPGQDLHRIYTRTGLYTHLQELLVLHEVESVEDVHAQVARQHQAVSHQLRHRYLGGRARMNTPQRSTTDQTELELGGGVSGFASRRVRLPASSGRFSFNVMTLYLVLRLDTTSPLP